MRRNAHQVLPMTRAHHLLHPALLLLPLPLNEKYSLLENSHLKKHSRPGKRRPVHTHTKTMMKMRTHVLFALMMAICYVATFAL